MSSRFGGSSSQGLKKMASTRVEVEKFDGKGDYMLWKEKLLAHLEILSLLEGLEGEEDDLITESGYSTAEDTEAPIEGPKVETEEQKTMREKRRKARSTIILSVGDNVLRKIIKQKTASGSIMEAEAFSTQKDK